MRDFQLWWRLAAVAFVATLGAEAGAQNGGAPGMPGSAVAAPGQAEPVAKGATAEPVAKGATVPPSSPAANAAAGAVPANPHVRNPHAADPHGGMAQDLPGASGPLLKGSPFLSAAHMQQARLARAGQSFQPKSTAQAEPQVPAGRIGIIVRDGQGQPVPDQELQLRIVNESIEHGNTESEAVTKTNAEGFAAFEQQVSKSSVKYEVIARKGRAKYSSGPFRLDARHGQIVTLYVFPTTPNIDDAFIFTRALYVVQPRDDVFQIQGLFRFENTNPITWIPEELRVPLAEGTKAFTPGTTDGDLRISAEDSAIVIKGSFTPGAHEVTFSFQFDNPGDSTARLELPVPPHMVDAKLLAEVSPTMTFAVNGMPAATETRGNDGQRALRILEDFLAPAAAGRRPEVFVATITGLPTRGWGATVAALLAAALALFGVTTALTTERSTKLDDADRQRAKELLLSELILVEKAFKSKKIGPKTYDQTRRGLLDALARLEAATG